MKNSEGVKALERVRRRVLRERRIYANLERSSTGAQKERAYGEANVCSLVIGYIDAELYKLRKP